MPPLPTVPDPSVTLQRYLMLLASSSASRITHEDQAGFKFTVPADQLVTLRNILVYTFSQFTQEELAGLVPTLRDPSDVPQSSPVQLPSFDEVMTTFSTSWRLMEKKALLLETIAGLSSNGNVIDDQSVEFYSKSLAKLYHQLKCLIIPIWENYLQVMHQQCN